MVNVLSAGLLIDKLFYETITMDCLQFHGEDNHVNNVMYLLAFNCHDSQKCTTLVLQTRVMTHLSDSMYGPIYC